MIGQTISHYRIVELLGSGGMGVVYKAEDTRLRRTVALKFLPLEITRDPEARERLLLEAQTASALDHPNICTIHEIDETPDGRVFVAMGFYEGETLKQRIARGPLAITEALQIGTGIARAVAAAHAAGVIHRDIKPANVIITGGNEVKLLDFGIAKLSGRTALTRTGVTVGTIAYMAPEQITGAVADQQTDGWSLGVVLYEMLTGRLPFAGEHEIAIINAIAHETPTSIRQLRPDVPLDVEQVVMRALEKARDRRHTSVRDMLHDLESLAAAGSPAAARTVPLAVARPSRISRRGAFAASVAIVVGAVAGAGWAVHASRVNAARRQLDRIAELTRSESYSQAYRLLRQIEPVVGNDPAFATARSLLVVGTEIRTTPPGAQLFIKGYDEPDAEWLPLGISPLTNFGGPLGYYRWRAVEPGYTTVEVAGGGAFGAPNLRLLPTGSVPDRMVFVPADAVQLGPGNPTPLPAFFIDTYEVTNRDFKRFVDAGGYTKREFWREPFVRNGQTVTWDGAMAELRDSTGRPGPAGWELGTYPAGQDDYPVSGVSWYEAVAYATWAGKELPTVHHWRRAGPAGIYSNVVEFSNFSNRQVAPVGAYKGLGDFGTYDMAGNVREWCWNATGTRRYILGGAWNEPNYMYQSSDAVDPFDRSAINGFRCMRRADAAPIAPVFQQPVERLVRDYSHVTPVPDSEFEIYRRLYAYDSTDLAAKLESVDDSSPDWRLERVSFAAAYGDERVPAYLFLPKRAKPPYQTVVYFPHSGGEHLRSFAASEINYLSFIVKGGRALLLPMYKGTYERRLERPADGPNAQRDLLVARIKDLERAVDYLGTRRDIDRTRIAYFGVSLGGRLGNVALAIEKRFRTAILWSAGFHTYDAPVPETDEVNYAPHVTTPILMLNGREDFTFPVESSQLPMFTLLGTPAADKRHVVYEGGHVFPFARIIKDTLDWLDKYLGVPQ